MNDRSRQSGPEFELTQLALIPTHEAVTDTYRHDAWGVLLASTGSTVNPHTYAGRERYYRMPNASMYHLGFRDYAQGVGRFTTADPARAAENWLVYVLNRPAAAVDPAGLACTEWVNVFNDYVEWEDTSTEPDVDGNCVIGWPPGLGKWVTHYWVREHWYINKRICSRRYGRVHCGRWEYWERSWPESIKVTNSRSTFTKRVCTPKSKLPGVVPPEPPREVGPELPPPVTNLPNKYRPVCSLYAGTCKSHCMVWAPTGDKQDACSAWCVQQEVLCLATGKFKRVPRGFLVPGAPNFPA